MVVCNAAFESQRLSELMGWLPEFSNRIKKMSSSTALRKFPVLAKLLS